MALEPTARHQRILTSLRQGDLLWEVPGQPYFTQYNERTGKHARVHLSVLEAMEEAGWIRRVSEEPSAHKLDFWQVTPEGRHVAGQFPVERKSHSLPKEPNSSTRRSA